MDMLKEFQKMYSSNAENEACAAKAEVQDCWMICNANGIVSLCSESMSEAGVIPGVTHVRDYVTAIDMPVFEDVLRRGSSGGDVCYELEAADGSGFEIVQVKSTRMFSSFGLEIRLYKNREEYLAATSVFGERLGKVFDYIGVYAADIDSVLQELRAIESVPSAIGQRLEDISRIAKRFMYDSSFANLSFAENGIREEKICDMVKVFEAVADCVESDRELPFTVAFENLSAESFIVCATEPCRYAQIILMMAVVTARLSDDKQCKITLLGDDNTVTVCAECRLKRDYDLYGRSDKLDELYRCLPATPLELMMLERFAFAPEWKTEYLADGKGGFELKARIVTDPNPDGFKYRDIVSEIPAVTERCLAYAKNSFLS